ncbi:MAG: TAXI family TRAP transporter solute-binding subunit [Phycisphaeraceae bacterium]
MIGAFVIAALAVAWALLQLIGGGVGTNRGDEPRVTTLQWATSAVGSGGHRAKVALMTVLNRQMDDYHIDVMPTPGAVATIRGYASGEFDGYYGADIAFHEFARNAGRFRGVRDRAEREPVQSFWAYTMEVGLAVRSADREAYDGWRDLDGRPVFTGPAPWDVRAHLERALEVLGVEHRYRELDTGLAGSALAGGSIDAFIAYTVAEASVAPWVAEAQLASDIAILNPSDEEAAALAAAGLEVVRVDADVFRGDVGVDEVHLVPFFYGFHLGLEVPADDVYRMLTIIERHAADLAAADPAFAQIARDMPGMQRRGVAASVESVRVHPGLARYMRERDVWDPAWDGRIASAPQADQPD